jgi:hypothetical protein
MKKYISAVLIPCLLCSFVCCSSSRVLENENDINSSISPTHNVKFILNNGEEISPINKCKKVAKTKFAVYGSGILYNSKTNKNESFSGFVCDDVIDSINHNYNKNYDSKSLTCWLKNKSNLTFSPNDYIEFNNLNPDSSYWLIEYSGGSYDKFTKIEMYSHKRAVNVNDVDKILLKKIETETSESKGNSVWTWVAIGLGIGVTVALIILLHNTHIGMGSVGSLPSLK